MRKGLRDGRDGVGRGSARHTTRAGTATAQWRAEPRPTGRDRRGDDITKRYDKPLTPEELAALPDEVVDTSDVPPLGPEFRRNARVAMPGEGKQKG